MSAEQFDKCFSQMKRDMALLNTRSVKFIRFNSINDFQTRSAQTEMDCPHGIFALKTLGLRKVF